MVEIDAEARARAQQKSDERQERLLRSWEDKALNELLSTQEGRQFVWWLLTIGKWQTMPYAGSDAATNFACGEMNVGNQIFARLIETNPQAYLRIVEDQNARSRTDTNTDAEPGTDHYADSDGA